MQLTPVLGTIYFNKDFTEKDAGLGHWSPGSCSHILTWVKSPRPLPASVGCDVGCCCSRARSPAECAQGREGGREGGRRLLSCKSREKDTLNHPTLSPHFLLHPAAAYEDVWIVNTAVTFSIKVSLFSPPELPGEGAARCSWPNVTAAFMATAAPALMATKGHRKCTTHSQISP